MLLVALPVAAGEVVKFAGEAEEPEGDGEDVGEFDEVGVGVGVGVPEGVGEGVAEAGIAWQLGLTEVAALRVTASSVSAPVCGPPARAEPGRPASMPTISRTPASMLTTATRRGLTTATRRGAKRIRIALSTLLVQVMRCFYWFGGGRGEGWHWY
ncbi:MAG: hypothetical protein JO037_15585 [Actinobacteria bacterium]|nr:hypothetical protein [Actinomycetota bacterium]